MSGNPCAKPSRHAGWIFPQASDLRRCVDMTPCALDARHVHAKRFSLAYMDNLDLTKIAVLRLSPARHRDLRSRTPNASALVRALVTQYLDGSVLVDPLPEPLGTLVKSSTVTLPTSMHSALAARARVDGLSSQCVIRVLVARYLAGELDADATAYALPRGGLRPHPAVQVDEHESTAA
jgi:hypothetical protein